MGRKELIERLKNYRMIKAKMLQSRYKEEELKEITISASTFEEKFGTDVTSSVENKAIKILEYQENIKEYALELAQLDNAMSVLNDTEVKVIRKRFIDRIGREKVGIQLSFSARNIGNIENRALDKMIEVLGC